MRYIIIPARSGSKALPNKNHVLVPITVSSIPQRELEQVNVILSTNDSFLKEKYGETLTIHNRSDTAGNDIASMRSVLLEVIADCDIHEWDDLIVLYPTYPTRTWQNVEQVWELYYDNGRASVLCAYPATESPHMMLGEDWQKIIPNDTYRRQDHPLLYIYSHYVTVVRAGKVEELDAQLMGENTRYYVLPKKPLDINTLKDML